MVAAAKVRELMLPKSASMQAINDTVGQWKMLIMKPVQEINSNPFILNLQNGLYNTLDDSFKAHTPEYFSTVQLKAAYAPDAGCPLFCTIWKVCWPRRKSISFRRSWATCSCR